MASNSSKNARQQRAEQMRKERERAEKRRRNGITIGIGVVVLVLVAVAAFAVVNQVQENNAPAATPANTSDDYGIVYDQEASGEEAGEDAAAAGEAVPVVVYEDFQCPVCQAFEASNKDFLDQQVAAGNISVEYRPLPYLDRASTTQYSSRSANAGACVADAGGAPAFHQFQDLLYTNQPPEGGDGLTDEQLTDYARQAGAMDIGSCIEDETYSGWVEEAGDAAREAEVTGTPTVLVGGEVLQGQGGGVPTQPELQQAITAAQQG